MIWANFIAHMKRLKPKMCKMPIQSHREYKWQNSEQNLTSPGSKFSVKTVQ